MDLKKNLYLTNLTISRLLVDYFVVILSVLTKHFPTLPTMPFDYILKKWHLWDFALVLSLPKIYVLTLNVSITTMDFSMERN